MTERETRINDMNESKTGFISGENPFLPVDRDTTVPVAQCNGLCHVTQTLSRHSGALFSLEGDIGGHVLRETSVHRGCYYATSLDTLRLIHNTAAFAAIDALLTMLWYNFTMCVFAMDLQ
jgi:hypothetical protein